MNKLYFCWLYSCLCFKKVYILYVLLNTCWHVSLCYSCCVYCVRKNCNTANRRSVVKFIICTASAKLFCFMPLLHLVLEACFWVVCGFIHESWKVVNTIQRVFINCLGLFHQIYNFGALGDMDFWAKKVKGRWRPDQIWSKRWNHTRCSVQANVPLNTLQVISGTTFTGQTTINHLCFRCYDNTASFDAGNNRPLLSIWLGFCDDKWVVQVQLVLLVSFGTLNL